MYTIEGQFSTPQPVGFDSVLKPSFRACMHAALWVTDPALGSESGGSGDEVRMTVWRMTHFHSSRTDTGSSTDRHILEDAL
jgi:hypothetical protein